MIAPNRFILDQDDAYDRPDNYRVFVEDEFRFALDSNDFPTVQDAIDAILSGHIEPLRVNGLKEFDLAIWQKCRLIAVIRTGPDVKPLVTLLSMA